MTVIQMVGSILAVPVGIASAYSFYRANFSPETTCQSLRSGIVAMLDKSVDASTRRILVRRDVEAFEKACASVDPDATAAFKTLLDVEKASAPVAVAPAPAAPKAQHTETTPKEVVRKVEPRPQPIAKQPAASAPAGVTEPARRDAVVSDTQWLDAVRQALVKRNAEPLAPDVPPTPKSAEQPVKAQAAQEPMARPVSHEAALPSAAPPAASTAAPAASALPPPIAIAPPPARQVDADHPVPPGSIPDSIPQAENPDAAKPGGQGHSRIRKWISEIPLLGPVVENGRQ